MSHADGESFAYSGRLVAARQAETIAAALSGASSTLGQERLSSIASTPSSAAHVSAYSTAEKPPTDTHSGTPSSRRLGRVSLRNRSRPGFASPIEFNMPASVSAIRTGGLPSRGSGVIVFVTKPSRERATSGAVNASRQPEALSSTEHRPLDAESLQLSVDLHSAAVAGAVATRHRRLPGELRVRDAGAECSKHRLRPAREHVTRVLGQQLRHVDGLDADLCVRDERCGLGVPVGAEAEDGRGVAEPSGEERQRSDPDPPSDEQRPLQVELEAVAER